MDKYLKYIQSFSDCYWNVPILCAENKFLSKLLNKYPNIKFIAYGSPNYFPMNSGRLDYDNITLSKLMLNIKLLNKFNIPCYLTMTKYNVADEELKDKNTNLILSLLSQNNNNGVLLSSDKVFNFIKSNYPDLQLKCSILKFTFEDKPDDSNFYIKMANIFDSVVCSPDISLSTLEKIPFSIRYKFEILVNEICQKNCSNRKNCYINLSRTVCNKDKSDSCELTLDEIRRLYHLEYKNYKLQGRSDQYFFTEMLTNK